MTVTVAAQCHGWVRRSGTQAPGDSESAARSLMGAGGSPGLSEDQRRSGRRAEALGARERGGA